MKLGIEFIRAANLPKNAIEINYTLDGSQFTIKNPIYAQIFWLHLWHNKLAVEYANQDMITDLHSYNMTQPVIFDADMNLKFIPPTMKAIHYYGNFDCNYKPWFLVSISVTTVLIFFAVCFILISIVATLSPSTWYKEVVNIV